jgi:hypothetical protein
MGAGRSSPNRSARPGRRQVILPNAERGTSYNLRDMLIDRIRELYPDAVFSAPAAEGDVAILEHDLGCVLPLELRSLLLETDGVEGAFGLGLVWSSRRIQADNLRFRSQFRDVFAPFDGLLFFADAGNGDQFAYQVHDGKPDGNNVYVWDHEDDGRRWAASSLDDYLEGWATGRITT